MGMAGPQGGGRPVQLTSCPSASGIIVLSDIKFEVNCDLGGYPIEVRMTLSPPMAHGSGKTKEQYKWAPLPMKTAALRTQGLLFSLT